MHHLKWARQIILKLYVIESIMVDNTYKQGRMAEIVSVDP